MDYTSTYDQTLTGFIWVPIIFFALILGYILFDYLETLYMKEPRLSIRKTELWYKNYKRNSILMLLPGVNLVIFVAYYIILKKT